MTTNASLPRRSVRELVLAQPEPDELVLAPYSVQEPEPTELEIVAPPPSYVHVISWRADSTLIPWRLGELLAYVDSKSGSVGMHVKVTGHPELAGSGDPARAWGAPPHLVRVFG